MLKVLKMHPHAVFKIKDGIQGFTVGYAQYGTKCFKLMRPDGSTTDFSYIKCIAGTKFNKKADFNAACRQAIKDIIYDFKKRELAGGGAVCPYHGTELTWKNSHVDHAPPNTFKEIVKSFLVCKRLDWKAIPIGGKVDNATEKYFKAKKMRDMFVEYHNELADLRLISAKANLSDVKKEHNLKKNPNIKLTKRKLDVEDFI